MNIFDIIKTFGTNLDATQLPEFEEIYNQRVVNKALSMSPAYWRIAAALNSVSCPISNEAHYHMIHGQVRIPLKNTRWVKSINESQRSETLVSCVSNVFGVSRAKALEYIELLPSEQLQRLETEFSSHDNSPRKKRNPNNKS